MGQRPVEADQRLRAVRKEVESPPDDRVTDPPSLAVGTHRQRAEDEHVDQPRRSIEQAPGEGNVADDGSVDDGDERQVEPGVTDPEGVDKRGDPITAEGRPDHGAHRRDVVRSLGSDGGREGHATIVARPHA